MPPIPARPTPADVAAARALICDELLGDFPFVSPAERAHAVALLLLGFLRGMVDGPTPLHLIEKPTPGTGATLMVDAIATILTGAGASVMTEGRDDDEWRKRVTAKLRQVPTILLIDNLRLKLDSSAVAAALTAPFWEDRILGQSEMARLPIRCLWIATGNNPEFSNEMARRLVRIRLDANVERPWQRSGFRHPDLMTWVRANRARLVARLPHALPGVDRRGPAARDAHHRQLRELGAGHRRRARGRRHRRLPRQPRRDDGGVRHRGRCLERVRRAHGGTGSERPRSAPATSIRLPAPASRAFRSAARPSMPDASPSAVRSAACATASSTSARFGFASRRPASRTIPASGTSS